MAVPSKMRRRRIDAQQRERRRRGDDWEQELANELDSYGWAKRWPRGWSGQPWDISAMLDGHAYAIECKRIVSGNLGYSCFTANEIENLSRWEDAGGCAVIAIRRDAPFASCFVPWYAVREAILAGERGSIRPGEWPTDLSAAGEIPRPLDCGGCRCHDHDD